MNWSSTEIALQHAIAELDRGGLRSFGFTVGAIFAAVFGLLLPWLFGKPWPLWPWLVAAPLWVLASAHPPSLRPVYRGWMRFGLLASRITTPLVLGLVFVLAITPVALIRRLRGRDPLLRSFDPTLESYRIESAKQPVEKLRRPF